MEAIGFGTAEEKDEVGLVVSETRKRWMEAMFDVGQYVSVKCTISATKA